MSRAGYRKLLKATFTEDFDTIDRLSAELADVPWKDSGLLVAAVFSLAIEERFADNATHEAVRAFVTQARKEFAAVGTAIKPLFAEGVIRAALGEEDLLDGIPPMDGVQVQIHLIHKILVDANASRTDIDDLLDQAEALLDASV